jgi:hypothetical protein
LSKKLPLSEDEKTQHQKRLSELYGLEEIRDRAEKAMDERDSAYRAAAALKGKVYVISYKNIRHFVMASSTEAKKSYSLGLRYIFPEGMEPIKVDEVELEIRHKPVEVNQLYYIRLADPDWEKREKPYDLQFDKKEGQDVYVNAVVDTPLFTLKAPKLRIKDAPLRAKIWILSRVK